MKMKFYELFFGFFFIAFVISMMFVANGFDKESKVFPLGILSIMLILLISIVYKYLREILTIIKNHSRVQSINNNNVSKGEGADEKFFINHNRFWLTTIFGIIYVLTMEVVGFFTSSIIFFVILIKIGGYHNWKLIVPTMLIFFGAIYIVFVWLFERPMPTEFFITLFN